MSLSSGARKRRRNRRDLIFPLSAGTRSSCARPPLACRRSSSASASNLSDIAFTLQHGRKSFDHRLAIVASTNEELVEKLGCFIGRQESRRYRDGHVKNAEGITRLLNRREKEEFIRLLSQGRDPHKLAQLWAEGLLADWQGFQPSGRDGPGGESRCRPIPSPTSDTGPASRPPVRRACDGDRGHAPDGRQQRIDLRAAAVQEDISRAGVLHLRPSRVRHSDACPASPISSWRARPGRSPPGERCRRSETSSG